MKEQKYQRRELLDFLIFCSAEIKESINSRIKDINKEKDFAVQEIDKSNLNLPFNQFCIVREKLKQLK